MSTKERIKNNAVLAVVVLGIFIVLLVAGLYTPAHGASRTAALAKTATSAKPVVLVAVGKELDGLTRVCDGTTAVYSSIINGSSTSTVAIAVAMNSPMCKAK